MKFVIFFLAASADDDIFWNCAGRFFAVYNRAFLGTRLARGDYHVPRTWDLRLDAAKGIIYRHTTSPSYGSRPSSRKCSWNKKKGGLRNIKKMFLEHRRNVPGINPNNVPGILNNVPGTYF